MSAWCRSIAIALILAACISCSRTRSREAGNTGAEPPEPGPVVEDLGPFPPDLGVLQVTRDGLHVAYYVASAEGVVVYIDGREIARCVGVPEGLFALSPDGSRWSGVLVTGLDKATVFIDGQPRQDLIGAVTFAYSSDSKGLAYVAVRTTGPGLVVNGEEQPPAPDLMTASDLRFLPGAKSVAYVVAQGKSKRLVIGGQAQPKNEELVPRTLTFTADGRHWAYAARADGKWVVVVDGAEVARFDQLGQLPQLSRDGARWACAGLRGRDVVVVTPDGETTVTGNMALGSLVLSDDGRHIAYIAGTDGAWRVTVDGRADPTNTDIANGRVAFSPDGTHYAYAAMVGGTLQDQAEGQPPRRVGALHIAMLDGRPGPTYDLISDGTPIFSPDGAHLAYTARRGDKGYAVLDGRELPTGSNSSGEALRFSPDSQHLAYAVFDDQGQHIAIDGDVGPAVETVIQGGPTWVGSDALTYLALKGDRLVRVRQSVPTAQADG